MEVINITSIDTKSKFELEECTSDLTFPQLNDYPQFMIKALQDLQYKTPSDIQLQIYDQFISNSKEKQSASFQVQDREINQNVANFRQNIIAQSKNGTGKTLAYSSLVISNLLKLRNANKITIEINDSFKKKNSLGSEQQNYKAKGDIDFIEFEERKQIKINNISHEEIFDKETGEIIEDGEIETDKNAVDFSEENQGKLNIKALILAPTREIALQVKDYFDFLTKYADDEIKEYLSTYLLIGGLDIKQQRKWLLVNKPNIIIGTPGRIKEILIDKEWLSLQNLNTLVIDEADKFCINFQKDNKKDSKQNTKNTSKSTVKFFEDLKAIISQLNCKKVQIAAFSATFNYETLSKLKQLIQNPVIIKSQSLQNKSNDQSFNLSSANQLENIQKYSIQITQNDFNTRLKTLSTLLPKLFKSQIQSIQDPETTIQQDSFQEDRIKAFEKMRLMQIKVILSTDLLSRGIDLPDVKYVINFDMPLNEAEFKHRIGRSGRFGRLGISISLISAIERQKFKYIEEMIKQGILLEYKDYENSVNGNKVLKQLAVQDSKEISKQNIIPQQQQLLMEQEIEQQLGKRKQKESMIIQNQELVKSNLEQKAQIYKKQKLESNEGKMSEWKELKHQFYDNSQFMYVDEEIEELTNTEQNQIGPLTSQQQRQSGINISHEIINLK
eukprot:403352736